jgi:hypothetical protein
MSQRFERIRTAFLLSLGLCLITSPGALGAELPDVTTVTAGSTATVQQAVGTAEGAVSVQQPEADVTGVAAAAQAAVPRAVDTRSLSRTVSRTAGSVSRSVTRPAAGTVRTLRTVVGKAKSRAAAVAPRSVKRVHLERKPIRSLTGRPTARPTEISAESSTERQPVRADADGSSATRSQGSKAQRPGSRPGRHAPTGPAEANTKQSVDTAVTDDLPGSARASATHIQPRVSSPGAPAHDAPGPAPPVALPALSGTASSSLLMMGGVLGLMAIFTLAAPGMGRAPPLRAAPWRPFGFASSLEQPG